jgi:hypothetical protein
VCNAMRKTGNNIVTKVLVLNGPGSQKRQLIRWLQVRFRSHHAGTL